MTEARSGLSFPGKETLHSIYSKSYRFKRFKRFKEK